jgi:hypothetical protein
MLVEFLQRTISLAARNRLPENMLLDGMCALGHVKRGHPQQRPRTQPALDFRCVPVGEIDGDEERSVSIDDTWIDRGGGC